MLLLGYRIASTVNVVPHLNILTEFQNSHANRSTILSTFGNVYASAGLEALCFQVVRLLCVCTCICHCLGRTIVLLASN